MKKRFILIFMLFVATYVYAANPPTGVQDEGGTVSRPAYIFDFVGAGVSVGHSGSLATVTVPGGGSSQTVERFKIGVTMDSLSTTEAPFLGTMNAAVTLDTFTALVEGSGTVVFDAYLNGNKDSGTAINGGDITVDASGFSGVTMGGDITLTTGDVIYLHATEVQGAFTWFNFLLWGE